jgi:flagellar basal-body rod protein FlgC
MGAFSALDISASGIAAQQVRMEVIAQNMAIVGTTRDAHGKLNPPKPLFTVLTPGSPDVTGSKDLGVQVKEIVPSRLPVRTEHNPDHPDHDADGNIHVPNVDLSTEMVDMMVASRSLEANITSMDMTRRMILSTIQMLA